MGSPEAGIRILPPRERRSSGTSAFVRESRYLTMLESVTSPESISALRADVMTAKVLVWIASVGRDAELTSDAHLYVADRYQRLADWHRRRGHARRARALQVTADEHYRLGGGDGPPYAAAMAMPRPARWIRTEAVGRLPDDAA